MQVEVDVKCMQTNFGGCAPSSFGDFAPFHFSSNFPFDTFSLFLGIVKCLVSY